jgi:hypothetical protein
VFVLDHAGGVCDGANCLEYGDNQVTFTAVANTTYYIVVDGYFGAVSDYTIDVSCGGGPAPGQEGAPCTADGDCNQGNCMDEATTGYPGGLCAEDCSATMSCTSPTSECVDYGGGDAYCLPTCVSQASCRPGYGCWDAALFSASSSLCFPDCDSDTQCDGGQCNQYLGHCYADLGLAPDGSPCLSDADCESQRCLDEASSGLPGGYCTSLCTVALDNCPGDGACNETIIGMTLTGYCLDGCGVTADCRSTEGYTCQAEPGGTDNVCWYP